MLPELSRFLISASFSPLPQDAAGNRLSKWQHEINLRAPIVS